jgi:hypothetical protein
MQVAAKAFALPRPAQGQAAVQKRCRRTERSRCIGVVKCKQAPDVLLSSRVSVTRLSARQNACSAAFRTSNHKPVHQPERAAAFTLTLGLRLSLACAATCCAAAGCLLCAAGDAVHLTQRRVDPPTAAVAAVQGGTMVCDSPSAPAFGPKWGLVNMCGSPTCHQAGQLVGLNDFCQSPTKAGALVRSPSLYDMLPLTLCSRNGPAACAFSYQHCRISALLANPFLLAPCLLELRTRLSYCPSQPAAVAC